jgi:glycine/D-amino acid oxidase-like deaminating enzyme
MLDSQHTPHAAYDPRYDPLRARNPGTGRDYAPTYWVATAGPPPADDGPILGDKDVDVAIIGSGYTGLNCAITLARDFGIKATVLEANRVAWGCSTRNGGQGQNATGRLSRSQWIARWGEATALRLHAEIREGFDYFTQMVGGIDCDAAPGGHLYVAHRRRALAALTAESEICNRVFGYRTRILDREALHRDWLLEAEAVGAMHEPLGIGVHPAKLAFGYLRAARAGGAAIHPASPALEIKPERGRFRIRTPGGTVRARAVAIATGGYTSQDLSNSAITRPLTPAEIAGLRFQTRQVITDTRMLRFYYRLLPDNRLQIGSRSAITGRDAPNPQHLTLLTDGIAAKFPSLRGIQIDYSWWGWVDVSHDMMPRIVQPHPSEQLFYAMGYGGNGVSYSAQAGRRLAQRIAGQALPENVPIFEGELPGHILAPFRRVGQRWLYHLYHRRDERPD